LIGLLRAIHYGWRQEKLADQAQEVSKLGAELYNRLSGFGDYLGDVGKKLGQAMQSYNKAVGSLDSRVFPAARKFRDLGVVADHQDLPDLRLLDEDARLSAAPELTAAYEDRMIENHKKAQS
jgi:DNA recombination protein RmuC